MVPACADSGRGFLRDGLTVFSPGCSFNILKGGTDKVFYPKSGKTLVFINVSVNY